MNAGDPAAPAPAPESLRLLKWNELVRRGDFVKDEWENFEPWAGPAGFRADAFMKQIFRRRSRYPAGAKQAS
jgi:hypothetical protein